MSRSKGKRTNKRFVRAEVFINKNLWKDFKHMVSRNHDNKIKGTDGSFVASELSELIRFYLISDGRITGHTKQLDKKRICIDIESMIQEAFNDSSTTKILDAFITGNGEGSPYPSEYVTASKQWVKSRLNKILDTYYIMDNRARSQYANFAKRKMSEIQLNKKYEIHAHA